MIERMCLACGTRSSANYQGACTGCGDTGRFRPLGEFDEMARWVPGGDVLAYFRGDLLYPSASAGLDNDSVDALRIMLDLEERKPDPVERRFPLTAQVAEIGGRHYEVRAERSCALVNPGPNGTCVTIMFRPAGQRRWKRYYGRPIGLRGQEEEAWLRHIEDTAAEQVEGFLSGDTRGYFCPDDLKGEAREG